MNKYDFLKIPFRYRGRQHLDGSSFSKRIQAYAAQLVIGNTKRLLISGTLINLQLFGDTNRLEHCKIEGFSGDTLFLSKFDYDLTPSKDDLKYDSTFALCTNKIKTMWYQKNCRPLRFFGYISSIVTGMCASSFFMILTMINPLYLLAAIAVAIPFTWAGNKLHRSMQLKKYDLSYWKIKPLEN